MLVKAFVFIEETVAEDRCDYNLYLLQTLESYKQFMSIVWIWMVEFVIMTCILSTSCRFLELLSWVESVEVDISLTRPLKLKDIRVTLS